MEVADTEEYIREINHAFGDGRLFTRKDLADSLIRTHPKLRDSSVSWLVYNLLKRQVIYKISRGLFALKQEQSTLAEYQADLSNETQKIMRLISGHYPLLSFSVWETRALNEFANHQLSRNMVFVEVEKPLDEPVFESLRERFECPVLYKPNSKEIGLYSNDLTISVITLTSEPPIQGHESTLEKILVDLFANKLLQYIVSRSEYPMIFDTARERYRINLNALLRYARRRGKEEEVKGMLS